MPAARYSDEFKTQVVCEVIEKDRTIASVAASYDLVAQTVGSWRKIQEGARHRPGPQESLRVSRDHKTQGRGS